jgi:hypothetical protein
MQETPKKSLFDLDYFDIVLLKKSRLNYEMIWKIGKKGKLKCEMINVSKLSVL